ncbi:hypothetical protein [Methylogaea oryzae]|uniref:hypothetical protein n=1 Tax=Methylogaea oryzae TaxID=1295382 RepID=UPI0006D0F57E|nr:hypothetical protein [Methylogaea oryzae]
MPTLTITQADARVEGVIDHFPSVGLRLRGAEALGAGYPLVAQALDAARLSERIGYCLQPYQILLAAQAGDGYVREWRMQHIDPDKSLATPFNGSPWRRHWRFMHPGSPGATGRGGRISEIFANQ